MTARLILALGIGGLAAIVALAIVLWKQMGVKSYGHPAGRIVRADQHLGVLIETRDAYMPSLKGVREQDARYSYTLWLIPETGDGDIRTIRLARGVASGSRTHNIGAQHAEGGILWLAIQNLQGIELATGQTATRPAPPSLINAPISQLMGSNEHPLEDYRAQSVKLPSGDWLIFASDEEVKTALKPGTRLYDNSTAKGTYRPRLLHTVTAEPGPIPRIATATALSGGGGGGGAGLPFKNGAFMRGIKGGSVVRFTNPDGFLVVHEQGDPVHPSMCLSRLNLDGSIVWTADTKIGRLTQVLPHEYLPAFVGELPQQLTEPLLAVIDLKTGAAKTKSLKGPLN